MKRFLGTGVISIFMLVFLLGNWSCKEETPADEEYTYSTTTLMHTGFDFSAEISDTNWQNNDGDVISWNPNNYSDTTYPSYKNYG